jgi:hypothetical protein
MLNRLEIKLLFAAVYLEDEVVIFLYNSDRFSIKIEELWAAWRADDFQLKIFELDLIPLSLHNDENYRY